jgi:hypothetical protein
MKDTNLEHTTNLTLQQLKSYINMQGKQWT